MQTFTSRPLVFTTILFSLLLLFTKGFGHSADNFSSDAFNVEQDYPQINIDLNKYVNGIADNYDNATCTFIPGANAAVDDNDSDKLPQSGENISIFRFNKDVSWEIRPSIAANDTLPFRLWNMKQAKYQFKIDVTNFSFANGSALVVLKDLFLNKEIPVSLTSSTLVDFNVTTDPASADKRFQVVILFRSNAPTPVFNLNAGKAIKIYPNPVLRSGNVQVEFQNKVAGKYTMTLYTLTGIRVQQSIVRHNGGSGVQSMALDAHLTRGAYLLEVMNEKGEKEQAKMVVE